MITLEDITVEAGTFRLSGISLALPRGAYGVLMGRTGCGKTTLLEAVCGLRKVAGGRILLHGRDVTGEPPAARGIGFVPQDGALFGHLTVRQQLEFPLVLRRWAGDRIATRVDELAGWLGIAALLNRHPAGLSGGETQRVALGRALAFHPDILCLDEPLSALDDDTRTEICAVLEGVRERTGVTVLHITHNLAEAHRLGDHLLLLRDGRIESRPLAPSR